MKIFASPATLHHVIESTSPAAALFHAPASAVHAIERSLQQKAAQGIDGKNSLVCAMGQGVKNAMALVNGTDLPCGGHALSQSAPALMAARRIFDGALPQKTPFYSFMRLPLAPFIVSSTVFQLARQEAHAMVDRATGPNDGKRQALALALNLSATLLTEGSRLGFAVWYAGSCGVVAAAGAIYGAGKFIFDGSFGATPKTAKKAQRPQPPLKPAALRAPLLAKRTAL
jgi:hypothetical protein